MAPDEGHQTGLPGDAGGSRGGTGPPTRWARISAGVSSAWLSVVPHTRPISIEGTRSRSTFRNTPVSAPRSRTRARPSAMRSRRARIDLLLAEEQPGLALLHQPEEGEVAGEGLHDRLDHARRARCAGGSSSASTRLEPPDEEVERLGDDAEVEILLRGEVAVERALADPRRLGDVVHADHVVGARRRRRATRPPRSARASPPGAASGSIALHRRASAAPGVSRPGGTAVGGEMELTGQFRGTLVPAPWRVKETPTVAGCGAPTTTAGVLVKNFSMGGRIFS